MATESILNKVNVFPSLSSFNNNSAAVDSNSLNLIKTGAVLVETYKSGSTGYRIWSDGFIEQWGKTSSSGRATTTVTLPKAMSNTNYNITISQAAASDTWSTQANTVTTTSFVLSNNYGPGSWWRVCGY